MQQHLEELRDLTIAEVGAPRMLTGIAQLEVPVNDLAFAADTAQSYEYNQDLGEASPMGIPTRRTIVREAVGVVGAITPWNFPHQINLAKIGPALAAGSTVVFEARPRHTLVRSRARGAHHRTHRLSTRRDQHCHLERSWRRRVVGQRPSGGHGVVHRVDGHRPQRDGRRGRDHQEGLPRIGRQVGVHRA